MKEENGQPSCLDGGSNADSTTFAEFGETRE